MKRKNGDEPLENTWNKEMNQMKEFIFNYISKHENSALVCYLLSGEVEVWFSLEIKDNYSK